MSGTAVLDLNGQSDTFVTVTGSSGDLITNSDTNNQSTLTLSGNSGMTGSDFGGTIAGNLAGTVAANIEVQVVSGDVWSLSGTANNYTGGTQLDVGTLNLGDGFNNGNGLVTGTIEDIDESTLDFNVVGSLPVTFTGDITRESDYLTLTKEGTGTLVLAPLDSNSDFDSLDVEGGTLKLGNANALPQGIGLTVGGTATVDLGNFPATQMPALGNVSLNDGIITDGTLVVNAAHLYAYYGRIDANVTGLGGNNPSPAVLDKREQQDSGQISGVPADTVIINGTESFSSPARVTEGTLLVNGDLATSLTVAYLPTQPGTLGGVGTVSGTVEVKSTGVLSLGSLTGGGTLTMGSLQLDSGSVVNDTVGSADPYAADVQNLLTIVNPTPPQIIAVNITFGTTPVPYQRLFQYGTLSNGGFG